MGVKLNRAAFNDWVYEIIDDYSRRYEVYCGGAGSGKSYGACQKILLKAMRAPRKVLFVRKVMATVRDSIWRLVCDLLVESGMYPHCKISRSEHYIELPNGGCFIFKGLDDPEKIKSITGITDIVIEEATELTLDDFTQLDLRLRPNCGDAQIYLMFNPVSKSNWVYPFFFENTPPNCAIYRTTYRDNRFLPPEYIKTLESLKSRSPVYYKIYCLGEFTSAGGLVFADVEKRIINPAELANARPWAGLDFGYVNDPSALVWGCYDAQRRTIFITGEYVKKGLLNYEIARAALDLGLGRQLIVADSAEMKSIDELKRHGLRVRAALKGPGSVIYGIQFMLANKIVVDERCVKCIEELENYSWKKDKSGNFTNEPEDCFNHTIDAIRYGLEPLMPSRPQKAASKPISRLYSFDSPPQKTALSPTRAYIYY